MTTLRPNALAAPDDPSAEETSHRDVCWRCHRPRRVCYCEHIPSLDTRTHLVFLQHLRERRMAIGTARMAHLALPNSEFHVGISFDENARVQSLPTEQGTFLLFPGPNAKDISELAPGELETLVVVDGTWPLARKLIKVNPVLLRLPQVAFTPSKPGNYRIRKEPAEHCLSTIEAVSQILGFLEGDAERFERMLRAFDWMVDRQIDHAKSRTGPNRHHRKPRTGPTIEQKVAAELRAWGERLVLVYAESNAIPLGEGHSRRHELVHLTAHRPATGESIDLLMVPQEKLDWTTPLHLELSEEEIRAGEPRASALARWSSFVRPDDIFSGWGYFTRSLVSSVTPGHDYVDMREQFMRSKRVRASGLDAAAALLAPERAGVDAPRGRARRRIVALELVYEALTKDEPSPRPSR